MGTQKEGPHFWPRCSVLLCYSEQVQRHTPYPSRITPRLVVAVDCFGSVYTPEPEASSNRCQFDHTIALHRESTVTRQSRFVWRRIKVASQESRYCHQQLFDQRISFRSTGELAINRQWMRWGRSAGFICAAGA